MKDGLLNKIDRNLAECIQLSKIECYRESLALLEVVLRDIDSAIRNEDYEDIYENMLSYRARLSVIRTKLLSKLM